MAYILLSTNSLKTKQEVRIGKTRVFRAVGTEAQCASSQNFQEGGPLKKKTLMTFVLLAALAVLGFAQSRDTGAIVGKVMDDQKQGLPGVTVTVTGKNLM